ncbi:fungal-specific transcription factor domain-containing protein [Fennellomyces sp. T-0311]|nr:fungal-specific transcription factor domain-containing protein [Fennellomyces sp. T-0311]
MRQVPCKPNGTTLQQSVCTSSPNDDSLISSEISLMWANSFFQHFNIFFPILSRHHFLYQLVNSKHTMSPLLRYAVYALGCRYINPEDRTAQMWFDKARALASHETAALPTVQALAIMCWYAYLAGDLHHCSTLRRQLYRALIESNLNQEPTNCSVVEQEMRRRALWVAYVMDQWVAVSTGERIHPVTVWSVKLPKLEDNQLYAIDCRKLQPPVEVHEVSVESALQIAVFSEMVKLVRVVCERSDAKAALTEWLLNLPPYLEFGKATDDSPPSPIARIFHMMYYTVQAMINRPMADGTTAANTIIHIAEQMVRNHEVKYLYNVFGLSLTLATTIHLENARLSDSTPASNNLSRSLNVIKQTNCTVVPRVDLDSVLHRFLVNRCSVVLDQQQRASPQYPQPYNEMRPVKRPCLGDDLERTVKRPSFDFSRWLPPEQQQYTIPSLPTGDYSNLVDLFTPTTTNLDFHIPSDWSSEQTLFGSTVYQPSPSSSSSSPMVTPKQSNPSPALTMATTPIESSPTSYFSPHAHSPSLLSAHGFDLTKEDEFIPDNFYSIDFHNTVI